MEKKQRRKRKHSDNGFENEDPFNIFDSKIATSNSKKKPKLQNNKPENSRIVTKAPAKQETEIEEEDIHVSDDFKAWFPFELHQKLLKGLEKLGFTNPTPIQQCCLNPAIKGRKDIVGAAETGSGKTLAFSLPILHRILVENLSLQMKSAKRAGPLALIITPSRELALQIARHIRNVASFTTIKVVALVGELSRQKQERELKRKPEIIVGTPGRIWELMQDITVPFLRNSFQLKFFVLDEVDRMVAHGHYPELFDIIRTIQSSG